MLRAPACMCPECIQRTHVLQHSLVGSIAIDALEVEGIDHAGNGINQKRTLLLLWHACQGSETVDVMPMTIHNTHTDVLISCFKCTVEVLDADLAWDHCIPSWVHEHFLHTRPAFLSYGLANLALGNEASLYAGWREAGWHWTSTLQRLLSLSWASSHSYELIEACKETMPVAANKPASGQKQ